jgi:hypothetical protein
LASLAQTFSAKKSRSTVSWPILSYKGALLHSLWNSDDVACAVARLHQEGWKKAVFCLSKKMHPWVQADRPRRDINLAAIRPNLCYKVL